MAASTTKKTPAAQSTRQQLDELDALLQKMLALPVNPLDTPSNDAPEETQEPRRVENSVLPRRVSLRPTQTTPEPAPTPSPEPEPTPGPVLGPRLVQADTVLPVREINPTPDEEPDEEWVPLRGGWQPSAQTWGPLAEAYKQQEPATPQDEPGTTRETVRIPVPTQTTTPTPTPTPALAPVPESSTAAMSRLDAVRQTVEAMSASDPVPPTPTPESPPSARTNPLLLPVVVLNRVYDVATYPLGPIGRWLRGGGRSLLALIGGLGLLASVGLLVLDWFDWTF